MESFHWEDYFETGLQEVDKQHFELVTLINRFGEAVAENEVVVEVAEQLFLDLQAYSQFHFREEELMMEREGISPEFLVRHKKVHAEFIGKVTVMYKDIDFFNGESARPLLRFLMHWLVYHILGMDQNMARQITAIKSGVSAEQAYLNEGKENNCATEALLNALGSMFQQVSDRNKKLEELNKTLEKKVSERTLDLQEANESLQIISITDTLTSLPNRRFAMTHLHSLWSNKEEYPISCMMIDADYFKQVNDSYGHAAGDLVLIELSKALKRSLRNDDVVCRLGGDEFLVICSKTDQSGAHLVAKQLLAEVQRLSIPVGDSHWLGSVSIGIATQIDETADVEELIKHADKGVYLSKEAGRNCIKIA